MNIDLTKEEIEALKKACESADRRDFTNDEYTDLAKAVVKLEMVK